MKIFFLIAASVFFSAPAFSGTGDVSRCEQFFDQRSSSRSVEFIARAFERLISDAASGLISAAELRQMLQSNDFFSIEETGPSQRAHLQRALAVIGKLVMKSAERAETISAIRQVVSRALDLREMRTSKVQTVRTRVSHAGTGIKVYEFARKMENLYGVIPVPGNNLIATLETSDSRGASVIRLMRLNDSLLTEQSSIRVNDGDLDSVVISKDGSVLYGVGRSKIIGWRLPTGEKFFEVKEKVREFTSQNDLAVSDDGRFLAFRRFLGKIELWDTVTGGLHTILWRDGLSQAFVGDSKAPILATLSRSGDLEYWNPSTGERARESEAFKPENKKSGAFARDVPLFAMTESDIPFMIQHVSVIDLQSHTVQTKFDVESASGFRDMQLSPDGRIWIAVSNGAVWLKDLESDVPPVKLEMKETRMASFSIDGATVWLTNDSGVIHALDLSTLLGVEPATR